MVYEIKYEKTAEADLDAILNYLINELHNIRAAQRLEREIARRVSCLRENPELFSMAASPKLARKEYRTFAVGNYIVFYKVDHKMKMVSIVHILYGKRDYTKHFVE